MSETAPSPAAGPPGPPSPSGGPPARPRRGGPPLHLLTLGLLVAGVLAFGAFRLWPRRDWTPELDALGGADTAAVDAAVEALGTEGGEAVVPALEARAVSNPAAANGATRALARVGSPAAIDALVALALSGRRDSAQLHAQIALGKLGTPGAHALAPVFAAGDVDVARKLAALDVLAVNESDAATDQLIAALDGQPVGVRGYAVEKLSLRQGARVTRGLIFAAREDEDPMIREGAITFLGERGDEDVTPVLLERLLDPSWDVRYAAASAIESIGDARAVRALVSILGRIDPRSDEKAHAVAIRIGVCLAKLTGREEGIDAAAWGAWLDDAELGPQLPAPE